MIIIEVVRPSSFYFARDILDEVSEGLTRIYPESHGEIYSRQWPDQCTSVILAWYGRETAAFLLYHLDGWGPEQFRVTDFPNADHITIFDFLQARREGRIEPGEYFTAVSYSSRHCKPWKSCTILAARKSLRKYLLGG